MESADTLNALEVAHRIAARLDLERRFSGRG
jgi:hypothetical protein